MSFETTLLDPMEEVVLDTLRRRPNATFADVLETFAQRAGGSPNEEQIARLRQVYDRVMASRAPQASTASSPPHAPSPGGLRARIGATPSEPFPAAPSPEHAPAPAAAPIIEPVPAATGAHASEPAPSAAAVAPASAAPATTLPRTLPVSNTGVVDPSRLASRGSRLGAALIDSAVGLVPMLFIVLAIPFGERALPLFGGLAALAVLALLGVQLYLLTVNGQTIGKLALNLRIVKIDTGENGGFVTNVLMRTFVNGLIGSIVPFYSLVDYCFIFREDRRCIHDLLAGTAVIREY